MQLEDDFNWITPTLAIGDFYSSTHPQCWHQFSAILNLSEAEHDGISREEHNYMWLPFSDGDAIAFAKRLPVGLRFMRKNEEVKTLVHCVAGVSRSVSFVLAYLCEKEKVNTTEQMEDVFKRIESRRPEIYPCQGFLDVIASRLQIQPPQYGW